MTTLVAFDCETILVDLKTDLAPRPVVASFSNERGETWLETPGVAAGHLGVLLTDPEVTIVTHNGPFDFGVFTHYYPDLMPAVFAAYEDGRIVCTQTNQKLIDIAAGCLQLPRPDGSKGYSLADLEWHYLKRSRHEDKASPDAWRFRYGELEHVPLDQWPAKATEYAMADAAGTLAVYQAQSAKYGAVAGAEDNYRAAWALHLFSMHGVRTDGAAVAKLEEELKVKRASYRDVLQAAGFLKLVPLSAEDRRNNVEPACYLPPARGKTAPRPAKWSKDMAVIKATVEAEYDRAGLQLPITDGGATSTDRDTLLRVVHPALNALGDASNVEKLLTTYIPLLARGAANRICARYNVLVSSGRTSCSDPNLQNLPRAPGVRECFVPGPGSVMVSVDYDTLELRALAQVCLNLFGESKMAEAIREGRDLHLEVAAQILGIPYAEALARKKTPEVKEARQFAKIANFGLPGGLGVTTLREFARTSYGTELSEAAARRLKAQWLKAWPEMARYFDYISRLVGEGGATVKSFGNAMLRGDMGYTDCCNHFFQNLAAQGAKAACFAVTKECYVCLDSPLYGCRPWGFIHDELILDIPEERLHEAAARQAAIQCAEMAKYIPDVPITASPLAMRHWLKKDEALLDSQGRLLPWD